MTFPFENSPRLYGVHAAITNVQGVIDWTSPHTKRDCIGLQVHKAVFKV